MLLSSIGGNAPTAELVAKITIFCKKGERITIFDTSSISHMPALIRADAILPAQWRKIFFSTVPSE